jgi:peptidyl-prolyl cis-trans isomerase D
MAKEKPTKIATKKHLARLERERRQTQLITWIAVSIIVIIVGAIGFEILYDNVLKFHQPVVTVNGDSVSLHEFEARVRIARQQDVDQYMQYYQFAQMFGIDTTSSTSSIAQTMNQIQTDLDTPNTIGNQVLEDITNDLLIRQYSKANGIVVTTADVDKAITDAFAYYPNGTPTPSLTPTSFSYSTLSATQYALVTPTLPPTLVPTATLDLTATLPPTETPTLTPQYTATATAIPSLTPTSTPYTLTGYKGQYKDALAYYAKMGMSEVDFRKIFFESNLYRTRVSDIVTASVTHSEDQVWARHILVADQATAQTIYNQLLGGADFTTLAAQNSLDTNTKSTGGDLGWFGKDTVLTSFNTTADAATVKTAAFALKIGDISTPVQTTTGWEIIQALGHEVRPLTQAEYQTAVTNTMNTWLTNQRSTAKIVIAGNWTDNVPTTPDLTGAFNSMYATATAYAKQSVQQPTPTP